jgi:hypothetical protein
VRRSSVDPGCILACLVGNGSIEYSIIHGGLSSAYIVGAVTRSNVVRSQVEGRVYRRGADS